ncbi:tryptase beta-2-like isoform X2 [Dreissena polymorpha]|nr:tryptase beta-2-like isoform X2 [Dreissena polymorpha]
MPLCNGAFNSMLRKTRVVNGRTIRRSEWPFLVSLHYLHSFPFTSQTHMKHLCGGALINPRYVITAGHCVGFFKELQDVNNWNVVLGEHNQYLPDLGEQVIKPEKFFIHPGFQPFSTFTLQNDLALIKLNKDADLSTSFVNTIPLEEKQDIKELTQCEIGGWGQVSSEPYGYGMYIPLKTNLYVVNNDTCFEAYESLTYDVGDLRMVIDDNVLCAGVPYALNSKPDVDHGYNDACN